MLSCSMNARCALLLAGVAACHPGTSVRQGPQTSAPECEPGLKPVFEGDSDVGWGEVEQTVGCARDDDRLQGRAVQSVTSAPAQPSTRLVGRYVDGRRVGTWTQLDAVTGRVLASFTLDDAGSGTEEIRDQLGHVRRGPVVAGKREGTWTHYDAAGKAVATETWRGDRFIGRTGEVPWDPPMMDPADRCPDSPGDGDDGCPSQVPAAATGSSRSASPR